eukprot:scaffold5515_cov148-Isochrysis_galbana.AAC.4
MRSPTRVPLLPPRLPSGRGSAHPHDTHGPRYRGHPNQRNRAPHLTIRGRHSTSTKKLRKH